VKTNSNATALLFLPEESLEEPSLTLVAQLKRNTQVPPTSTA